MPVSRVATALSPRPLGAPGTGARLGMGLGSLRLPDSTTFVPLTVVPVTFVPPTVAPLTVAPLTVPGWAARQFLAPFPFLHPPPCAWPCSEAVGEAASCTSSSAESGLPTIASHPDNAREAAIKTDVVSQHVLLVERRSDCTFYVFPIQRCLLDVNLPICQLSPSSDGDLIADHARS